MTEQDRTLTEYLNDITEALSNYQGAGGRVIHSLLYGAKEWTTYIALPNTDLVDGRLELSGVDKEMD